MFIDYAPKLGARQAGSKSYSYLVKRRHLLNDSCLSFPKSEDAGSGNR